MINFDNRAGTTPLDSNEINGLKLNHITTLGELNQWEQINILKAVIWVNKVKPKKILNDQFVKQLHYKMFNDVWSWAGTFRQTNKTIGCEWYQIPMSLRNLFDDTKYWIEQNDQTPDVIGVTFHHRLVAIHPFPNGNGRHARLMTDILLENILACSKFTWGSVSSLRTGNSRERYIQALHEADGLNYEPLLEFVRS
ncbi:MAG: mobile mystery protein B [Candidatus Cloacimonadales bacterium]|nr:mobile mystery protein B [Candidatus Cloacimonadales bacterium]